MGERRKEGGGEKSDMIYGRLFWHEGAEESLKKNRTEKKTIFQMVTLPLPPPPFFVMVWGEGEEDFWWNSRRERKEEEEAGWKEERKEPRHIGLERIVIFGKRERGGESLLLSLLFLLLPGRPTPLTPSPSVWHAQFSSTPNFPCVCVCGCVGVWVWNWVSHFFKVFVIWEIRPQKNYQKFVIFFRNLSCSVCFFFACLPAVCHLQRRKSLILKFTSRLQFPIFFFFWKRKGGT